MLKSYHILRKLAIFFLDLYMTSVMVWLDSSVITYFQYCGTESVQHFCHLILICCVSINKRRSKSQKRDEGRVRKQYQQMLPAGFTWGGTSPHQKKMLAIPPASADVKENPRGGIMDEPNPKSSLYVWWGQNVMLIVRGLEIHVALWSPRFWGIKARGTLFRHCTHIVLAFSHVSPHT